MPEIKKVRFNEPADIVIYVKDCGTVIREKSLIAIDKKECKTVAVGNEAECLDHRFDDKIMVISPLRQGMITDFMAAREMFKGLFQKAQVRTKGIQRPKRIAVSDNILLATIIPAFTRSLLIFFPTCG